MATEQANITEDIVHIGVEAARVAVQAMAMATTDNKGHKMCNPKEADPSWDNLYLIGAPQICRTEELQNWSKEYVFQTIV